MNAIIKECNIVIYSRLVRWKEQASGSSVLQSCLFFSRRPKPSWQCQCHPARSVRTGRILWPNKSVTGSAHYRHRAGWTCCSTDSPLTTSDTRTSNCPGCIPRDYGGLCLSCGWGSRLWNFECCTSPRKVRFDSGTNVHSVRLEGRNTVAEAVFKAIFFRLNRHSIDLLKLVRLQRHNQITLTWYSILKNQFMF